MNFQLSRETLSTAYRAIAALPATNAAQASVLCRSLLELERALSVPVEPASAEEEVEERAEEGEGE